MTKTHTMRSRLISLVLVLVMVLGCLPLSAMAADPPTSSFTQSWGNFEGVRIGASITTGYTLQTVSGSNPIQETKLNLTVLADASIADKTYDYFYIDLQDAEGNTVRRVMWSGFTVEDKTLSSGTYEFTTAGSVYTQKREDDGTLTRDPSALQPTVSFDGKYAYINGVAYTVEGAGTFPVYAQVGYQVSSTAVTLPAQRIGTFNIASYSDDVMTKNLTFNLDATDAYYAYSTVAMVANEKYVLPTVTPIRDHYTFKGWKLNDTTYLPGAEIPYTLTSTDLMLTALWERDTVQFSAGHTDLPEGVKFLNDKVKVMLDGEEITNQIFVDPSNTNTLILPYGSEVYFTLGLSEYYDPATLEVVVGDYLLAPINVEQGDLVAGTDTTPADQLTNYTYMFKVTEDVSWTVRDVLAQRTFVVTMPVGHFNAELVSVNGTALGDTDSKVSASVIYSKGYTFTVEPMDGYEITGVYVNGAELTAVNDVYTVQDVKTAQNVEVLVKEIPNYTITYVVNNTQYATQVVAEGSQITNMPKSPDVTGYDFEGWYTQGLTGGEGDKILTTTTVNGDMIVYAKLTAKTYTISYDTNSNGEVTTSITASKKTYDQPVKLDATVLTRPGYTFLGWSRNQSATEATYAAGDVFTEEITEDITLYAVWKANTYTVTLPTGTGYTVVTTQENVVAWNGSFSFDVVVDRGYVENAPVVKVTNGTVEDTLTATNTNPAANTDGSKTYSYTISAIKENKVVSITVGKNQTYTVTFEVKNKVYQTQEVEYGYYATAPVAPEVMGYTFNGWKLNGNDYDFSTPVTNDITLIADLVWITNPVTLSVDGDGYSVYHEYTPSATNKLYDVGYNQNFAFKVVVKDGYSDANMFVVANGAPLYYNSKTYDETAKTTTYNYTLYNVKNPYEVFVNGVERKTVTITYIDNGGVGGPTQQVANYYVATATDNSKVSDITPTRDGYVFQGWAKTNTATANDVVYKHGVDDKDTLQETTDTTLYAVWARAESKVELEVEPDEQFEGSEVTLTATVSSGGTGSVLFYRSTDDANNTADDDTLVGTSDVSGDKATATVEVKDYAADAATDYFYAVFKPTDGAGYTETPSNVVSVTVKSTTIVFGDGDTADDPIVKHWVTGSGLEDVAGGQMVVGETYHLQVPAIYAEDDTDYDSPLDAETVTDIVWQYRLPNGEWQTIVTNDRVSIKVTPDVIGMEYRAILTPKGDYKGEALKTDETKPVLETETTVDLTVAPTEQYEGKDVTLTAAVTTNETIIGEGSVQFYLNGEKIGQPVPVNTESGVATLTWTTSAYSTAADATNKDVYKAEYLGTATYDAGTSGEVEVTVRSAEIVWGTDAEGATANKLTITQGATTVESMIAGQSYTLTVPAVYAADDDATALIHGTDYTVEWWVKHTDGDWQKANTDDSTTYYVTSYTEGDVFYAKVLPAGNYTYTVLSTEPTEAVGLQETATALDVTDTNNLADDTLAEFEGQDVTLTASVTYDDKAVTEGSVQFYLNGVEIGQPVAVNAETGEAVLTWTTSKYEESTDSYTAKYLGTATYDESETAAAEVVTIRSTAISWKLDTNGIVKGADKLTIKETVDDQTNTVTEMVAGHTYTLELPAVYALDNMTTEVSEYTVTWQKKDAQQDWVTVADAGDTYTVTSYKVGDEYRAVVTPADPYTKAQAYNTDGTLADGYVKTLIADTGVTVELQPTTTTLEVSDTHDIAVDDGSVLAEFEGQNVTLTATVVDQSTNAAVTTGYVQFYRDEVKVGNEIGEPVAVNGNNGTATIEATMSSYEKDGKVDSYIAKYLTNETFKESVSEAKAVQIRSTAIAWGLEGTGDELSALTIYKINTANNSGTLYEDTLVAGETYRLELPDVFERGREANDKLTVNTDYRVDWYQFNADATQGELIASLVNLDTVTVKPETDGVGYYAIVTPVDGSNYTKAWTMGKYNNFLITATEELSGATPTEIALTIDGAVAMNNSWEQYEGRTITLNAKVNVEGNTTTMVEHGNVSFYVITKQEGEDQVTVTSELIGGQPVAVENGMASVTYELPEYLLNEGLENIEYFYAVYEDVSTELSGEVRYASSTTATVANLNDKVTTEKIPVENQLQVRSFAITWELNADKTAIAGGANDITIYSYNANNAADGYKGDKLDSVMDADETYVLEMPAVYAYDAVTGTTELLTIGTDYTVQWQYYVKDAESWMDYKGKDAYSASIVVTPEYHDYGFRVQVTPKYDNDSLTGFRKAAKYDGNAVAALDFQVLYSDTTVPTDRKGTVTDLTITGADNESKSVMINGNDATFTADHYAQFEGQTVTLKATVTEADAPDVMIPNGYVYFYRYEGEGQTVLLNATPVEVKDGIAELEVKITSYNVAKAVTENADKFFAVYEPNDTYDGSASTTKTGTAYDEPEAVDWVYIKSTSIKTPIVESALPGKIDGKEAKATTYTDDLTELQAGVEHTFTLRQEADMAEQDYSVVALDGRYVEDSNYTIQWLVKNGDNEETTAAENVNPYVTTTTKTGDMYRLWLEPKGDMTVGAYSEHLIVGTKQLVNVTVVASDEIDATVETDVYQLNDITLTATVEGAEPENTMKPTGTVTFYYRTKDTTSAWTEIGEAALAEDSVTGKMVATLVTDELPVDAEAYTKRDLQIYAIYNGDETFEVSATATKVQDEELFNIAGTEGSTTVDDTVTVYSSVVLRSSKENEAQTYTAATPVEDGLMAWVDGSLLENEENVTLNLTSIYTLDGEDDAIVSLLEHNTDYTIAWQEITNYSAWKDNITSADTPWTTLDNSNTHSYSVSVKQGAAYRAVITVKDAAAVQGSWNEVLQAAAQDATTGSKVYYSNILVAQPGQATVTYNVTTSNQTDGYEGIVEGEDVTIHTYVNGATETTPISEIKVTITNADGEEVFSDVRYNVNGYSSSFEPWTTTAPGYYEMTITATSSNGYAPSTIKDTLIVRDDNYTLSCTKDTFVYDGLVQGIEWTLSGMDIENTMAQNSVVVYYYDADGNLVEPTQAGTYSYKLILPESAYWTEKFIEGTLTVEQRLVNVVDLVPQTKVYDGTTNVNLLEIVLNDAETDDVTGLPNKDTGIINGDSIYATGTGYITAPNAGTETLRVKDLVLHGDDAHNYKLPENTGYSEEIEVLRNQLKGDIADATYAYTGSDITLPAEDVYLINQQGDVTDYVVTYYYHNGEGVEKVDAMNAKGMYTVVVGKDDNYKGGASQTVYVADTAVDAEPVKTAVSTLISITDTAQLYGESDGVKVALTNASATYTLYYNVDGEWVTAEPKDAGRYLVKVTTSTGDTAYGLYTITKANPVLTLTAAGITYDSAPYDGAVSGTYNGSDFPEGTYYTYAGGNILGVAYEAPTEAGNYVITAHVPETDNYTAHEVKANFTIAKAPLTIKADQLQRFLYSAYPDAVCTYTGLATGGVAPDTSLRDIQIQPELNYTDHSNVSESVVGWFQVEPVNALAKNYEVTYEVGEFSATELDPQPELAIHGAPQNGLGDGTIVAYYGDAIQLYAYGNQKNGTINKSSVLKWSVTGPAAFDTEYPGLLHITGVGTVVVTLTRGEGTLAISTSITIDARKQEVKVQLADQDKVYNGDTQTYDGTVSVVDAKYATVTANVDLDNLSRRPVGSQIVTGQVADSVAYYQSEVYGGLFTINDEEAVILPNAVTTIYGTKATMNGYTENAPVGSDAAVLSDGDVASVADAYGNLDAGEYEILVAGREDMNYNVSYKTRPVVTVNELDMDVQLGSYANVDTERDHDVGMTGIFDGTKDFPANGAVVTPLTFEVNGLRMFGEPNQVMGFQTDALIPGDSEADLAKMLAWLVEFQMNDHVYINADANITYPSHDGTPVKITSRDYDYDIESTMDYTNYDVTIIKGTQNIYQRPVTLSLANGVTKPNAYFDITMEDLIKALEKVLVAGKYNGEGGLADLLNHTIKDLDLQFEFTTEDGKTWDGSESYVGTLHVKVTVGNLNYWLANPFEFDVELLPYKYVVEYNSFTATSATVTLYKVDKDGNREAAYLPDGVDLVGQIFTKLSDGATYDDYVASGVYKEYTMVKNSYVTGRYTVTYPRLTGNYRFYATVKDVGYNIISQ